MRARAGRLTLLARLVLWILEIPAKNEVTTCWLHYSRGVSASRAMVC